MEGLLIKIASIATAVAVLALFYIYIGYPLLLAAIAAFVRRKRPDTGHCPRLTVLISAYNEEASIERKLRETLALEYPQDRLEILVVSDGSTDRTDEIVQAFTDSRVRLLRVNGRRGKTYAQNQGVAASSGDIIVFSDATAVYHPQALLYLACNYADPGVGAVSGRYQYFDPDGKSPTGLGSIAFWNYENTIKKLQSKILTLTGCSGCIYSVRRDLYVPLPADACSDLVEPLCIVRNRYRVAFEDRALAYELTTKTSSQEFRMRVRVATRGMRGVVSVGELLRPWQFGWVSFQLLSHKLLRWMASVFLLILFFATGVIAFASLPFAVFFTLQALFYAIALVSLLIPFHTAWKPLGLPLFFCTLNAAALMGMIELLRGNKYTVWETIREA